MIKTIFSLPPIGYKVHLNLIRNVSTSWDLVTAVCVERPPIVAPPLSKQQKDYNDLLQQIEFEKSMKSDHEIRHENDIILKKKLTQETEESADIDSASKSTAQDFEDAANDEFGKFQFASIETEADRSNNTKSLDRKLQSHLVLLTEQKLGSKSHWIFPQGVRNEGETLRQAAERVFQSCCGDDLKVQFIGNAPYGFYKYKYPNGISDKLGAKIFFYYARYLAGDIADDSTKRRWLTRHEMETILPAKYCSSVRKFLAEERD